MTHKVLCRVSDVEAMVIGESVLAEMLEDVKAAVGTELVRDR